MAPVLDGFRLLDLGLDSVQKGKDEFGSVFTFPEPFAVKLSSLELSRRAKEVSVQKNIQTALAVLALAAPVSLAFAASPTLQNGPNPTLTLAQGEAANPAEFTLTDFTDTARGWSFKRPSSWTQDSSLKDGVRFAGGDEWLTLQVVDGKQNPEQYTSSLAVPAGEIKLGIKPFKQGKFSASVLSSSAAGKSSVTGKPTDLLVDRWVFSPKPGKLAVLAVAGPKKVFDWEGNRDMALSVRLK